MTTHRYPAGVVAADLSRAGLGMALVTLPLLLLPLPLPVALLAAALLILFAAYAVQALLRAHQRIETDAGGVRLVGRRRPVAIGWDRLERLHLRYHTTRRDGSNGWMTLTLAGGRRLAIDSRIDGFAAIAGRASTAAVRRGLPLDAATRRNLAALGLHPWSDGGT
jgi:hypothetical protein